MTSPVVTPKLTIELVPSTCWYSNVRTNVSAAEWEKCKRFVRARSGDCCEVCGQSGWQQGYRWAVECHEVWEYTDEDGEHVQRLFGLIALCPRCHEVKHIGRAEAVGSLERAVHHLMWANGWSDDEAEVYIYNAFTTWRERSEHQWTLDISYLTEVLGP